MKPAHPDKQQAKTERQEIADQNEDVEATWLDEAERRAKQLDSGEVHAVSAEEFLKKARGLIR